MNRHRLAQTIVLFVGLVGLGVAVASSVDDVDDQVLPSPQALAVAALLALVAILSSGRAWSSLFGDVSNQGVDLARLRGTFYLTQLTKYLPAGGLVQAASMVTMAATAGVPIGRVAVAFPVSAVCSIAAGATLGAGLAFEAELPGWSRALALVGFLAPAVLYRRLLEGVLGLARRMVTRIPNPDRLPSQRCILASYGWALMGIGSFGAAYTVLLASLSDRPSALTVFSAYAVSWVIGFLAVPIPAGVGIREGMLVALIPGVGAAALVAASLALRLLSVGTELVAILGNRLAVHGRVPSHRTPPESEAPEAPTTSETTGLGR